MKKIKYLLIILFMPFLLTGCGDENFYASPEKVAEEMARRMSEGDYADIAELLYADKEIYVDEKSFENYLKDNELFIEGNETYELNSSQMNEDETAGVVKLNIDNGRILEVNTVKKDEKWYVYLDEYEFEKDLVIKVPSGVNISLNGNKLDFNKYGSKDKVQLYWEIGYKNFYYEYQVDIYTIPYLFEGIYEFKAENENIETIVETISSSYYDFKYDLKQSNSSFSSKSDGYVLVPKVNSSKASELSTFFKGYYDNLLASGEAKSGYESISKYFDSEDEELVLTTKKDYEEFVNSLTDTRYSSFTYYSTDLKGTYADNDGSLGYYYLGEGRYMSAANVTIDYTETTKYSSGYTQDRVKQEQKVLGVVSFYKKISDGFVITDGYSLIPEL